MKKTVEILGISFFHTTREELKDIILQRAVRGEKCFIVTGNPEIVMHAKKNPEYLHVIRSADFVIPDGSGIILASKILKRPLAERIAGFDFMGDMLRIAAERSLSVYLLGAEDGVVKTAAANIRKQYPNIRIAGFHHGYFDLRDEEVARRVAAANPDFIFVALGFPKQEIWIRRYLPMFEKGVFMGVGGSFDVLAGKAKRAPEFWRRLNLEWLYRLIQQPSRWRRMLALPEFVLAVLKERF